MYVCLHTWLRTLHMYRQGFDLLIKLLLWALCMWTNWVNLISVSSQRYADVPMFQCHLLPESNKTIHILSLKTFRKNLHKYEDRQLKISGNLVQFVNLHKSKFGSWITGIKNVRSFSELIYLGASKLLPRNEHFKHHFTCLKCELPQFLVPRLTWFFFRFHWLLGPFCLEKKCLCYRWKTCNMKPIFSSKPKKKIMYWEIHWK